MLSLSNLIKFTVVLWTVFGALPSTPEEFNQMQLSRIESNSFENEYPLNANANNAAPFPNTTELAKLEKRANPPWTYGTLYLTREGLTFTVTTWTVITWHWQTFGASTFTQTLTIPYVVSSEAIRTSVVSGQTILYTDVVTSTSYKSSVVESLYTPPPRKTQGPAPSTPSSNVSRLTSQPSAAPTSTSPLTSLASSTSQASTSRTPKSAFTGVLPMSSSVSLSSNKPIISPSFASSSASSTPSGGFSFNAYQSSSKISNQADPSASRRITSVPLSFKGSSSEASSSFTPTKGALKSSSQNSIFPTLRNSDSSSLKWENSFSLISLSSGSKSSSSGPIAMSSSCSAGTSKGLSSSLSTDSFRASSVPPQSSIAVESSSKNRGQNTFATSVASTNVNPRNASSSCSDSVILSNSVRTPTRIGSLSTRTTVSLSPSPTLWSIISSPVGQYNASSPRSVHLSEASSFPVSSRFDSLSRQSSSIVSAMLSSKASHSLSSANFIPSTTFDAGHTTPLDHFNSTSTSAAMSRSSNSVIVSPSAHLSSSTKPGNAVIKSSVSALPTNTWALGHVSSFMSSVPSSAPTYVISSPIAQSSNNSSSIFSSELTSEVIHSSNTLQASSKSVNSSTLTDLSSSMPTPSATSVYEASRSVPGSKAFTLPSTSTNLRPSHLDISELRSTFVSASSTMSTPTLLTTSGLASNVSNIPSLASPSTPSMGNNSSSDSYSSGSTQGDFTLSVETISKPSTGLPTGTTSNHLISFNTIPVLRSFSSLQTDPTSTYSSVVEQSSRKTPSDETNPGRTASMGSSSTVMSYPQPIGLNSSYGDSYYPVVMTTETITFSPTTISTLLTQGTTVTLSQPTTLTISCEATLSGTQPHKSFSDSNKSSEKSPLESVSSYKSSSETAKVSRGIDKSYSDLLNTGTHLEPTSLHSVSSVLSTDFATESPLPTSGQFSTGVNLTETTVIPVNSPTTLSTSGITVIVQNPTTTTVPYASYVSGSLQEMVTTTAQAPEFDTGSTPLTTPVAVGFNTGSSATNPASMDFVTSSDRISSAYSASISSGSYSSGAIAASNNDVPPGITVSPSSLMTAHSTHSPTNTESDVTMTTKTAGSETSAKESGYYATSSNEVVQSFSFSSTVVSTFTSVPSSVVPTDSWVTSTGFAASHSSTGLLPNRGSKKETLSLSLIPIVALLALV